MMSEKEPSINTSIESVLLIYISYICLAYFYGKTRHRELSYDLLLSHNSTVFWIKPYLFSNAYS